ncbi:MAG: DUF6390 family protein [bacterium]
MKLPHSTILSTVEASFVSDGLLRSSRYAFGPNKLHYCGPDQNRELGAYLEENASDQGLRHILSGFETMYPYLCLIASANRISDPLDDHVVEAYWIGNELLEAARGRLLYRHLDENLGVKKKIGRASFEAVEAKIEAGALPHHSFHVFSVWKRTGHEEREHTLKSLDACRISVGKVISLDGPKITVQTDQLTIIQGKIVPVPTVKTVFRQLESLPDIENLKPGDLLTLHWDTPCEVIQKTSARRLNYLNSYHLNLLNATV